MSFDRLCRSAHDSRRAHCLAIAPNMALINREFRDPAPITSLAAKDVAEL
jgi:hypothetical protein